MQELESKLQAKIIKHLKTEGWFVRKILSTNCPGDPDIYSYKNGLTVWYETKQLGKRARPLQEYRHNEIKNFGMQCYTIDSYELFMSIFASFTPLKQRT